MKVLILSTNTGQGHNTAGRAMLEALKRRGVDADMKDVLTFGSRRASEIISGGYVRMTQNSPKTFGRLYRAGEAISSDKLRSPVYYANRLYAERLGEFISANGYDTVLSPHLFGAEAMSFLRRRRGMKTRSFGIATDYVCTPFWEETDVDLFFIPHEKLRADYERKGFAPERLIATGIPVSHVFSEPIERTEARRTLSVPDSARVIMLMGGSMGFGDLPDIIGELLRRCGDDTRIFSLIGSNEKMASLLKERFGSDGRLTVVPFTREVAVYMAASDVLLSKPGGLSSTEAAVKNIPLVHTAPIPGCETINARFFDENGLSVGTFSPKESALAALWLSSDSAASERMLYAQRQNMNKNAADDICSIIEG